MAILALAFLTSACGSDGGDGENAALPRVDEPVFGAGEFADIELVTGSRPLTDATEQGGVVSQSFAADMTTAEEVMRFYRSELPESGWVQAGAVEVLGDNSFRGEWLRDDTRLEVSTGRAPAIDTDGAADPVTAQYSLILRPAETPTDLDQDQPST